MKILVTGANGFLGSHVVAGLLNNGHEVNALVRPASRLPAWSDRIKVYRADLRAPGELSEALQDMDAVIHLAAATSGSEDVQFASTVVGTENLLAAMAQSTVRRLLHVSSLVVYDWSKAKGSMDENTPLEVDIYPMGGYAIAKYWQERLVWRHSKSTGCELTVLRPGFIWGKDHTEIAGMGRRLGILNFVIGPAGSLPLTHVENCANCIISAIESPNAVGEAFNVVDRDAVSAWRYVGEYISQNARRGIRIPIPYRLGLSVAAFASSMSRWRFGQKGKLPSILTRRRFEAQFKPLKFSSDKARRVMGWSSPHDFEECVKRTYVAPASKPDHN